MTFTRIDIRLLTALLCIGVLYFTIHPATAFAQNLKAKSEDSIEKQMEDIKARIERSEASPSLLRRYDWLVSLQSDCTPAGQAIKTFGLANPLAPTASLCINGSIAATDPTYNRVLASSTGTGVGTGVVGNCSLSGSGTAVRYDAYGFNISGCAAFPTVVTASLCGPAGCSAPQSLDSVLTLYRNVAAGDPLTANGGLAAVFNPASPCTNARAANDDTGATPTTTGGSTCNQSNTSDCLPQCGTSTALSAFKRNIGSGRFTIVVTGFGNTTVGNYNLYIDAPAAGCTIALAPTAAGATISGRVSTNDGFGLGGATVSLSGGDISRERQVKTNPFGYYSFEDVPVGLTYILTAKSKRYAFENPTRVVNLLDSVTGEDFVAAP
jgi:hypothetical protein